MKQLTTGSEGDRAAAIHNGEPHEARAIGLEEERAPAGRSLERLAIDQHGERPDPALVTQAPEVQRRREADLVVGIVGELARQIVHAIRPCQQRRVDAG